MKKLTLLLLFIPLVSFGQLTYKDVMSINSDKQFVRVMIENNYELSDKEDGYITYGYEIDRDSIEGNKSAKWGQYSLSDGEFSLSFSRNSLINSFLPIFDEDALEREGLKPKSEYDLIVEDIKKNCTFYNVITENNGEKEFDYSCYSCSESKYKGKIGFMISEGWGVIKHFIKD